MITGGKMKMTNELRSAMKEYLKKTGKSSFSDLDTPSFIRKDNNFVYSQQCDKKHERVKNVPGPVTALLNVLFGEDDVKFAY